MQRNQPGSEMVIQPAPWRVLKLYLTIACLLTLGPILVGFWSGVVGYLLTSCPPREIVDRCLDLVGYAPFFGAVMVALAVPAGWVILAGYRKRYWRIGEHGVDVIFEGRTARVIAWSEIHAVRVGANGPLILMNDRTQDGEQLFFVPKADSVRLHREWIRRASN